MKAYQITGSYSITSLELVEKEIPEILPDEILIKLNALSLNYRDLLVINGVDQWRPPVGRIPVSDGVGTVVALGKDVKDIQLHDRVAPLFITNWIEGKLASEKLTSSLGGRVKDGLLQEYAVFKAIEVIRIPAYLTDEEAATLPCAALTAWHGLMEKGEIKPGHQVLIQGTGGVSLFSMQFAQIAGAEIIALSGNKEKIERLHQMGIKRLINYRENPDWENKVLKMTDGTGVHHVVEVVGGESLNKSIEATAIDGTISLIGLLGGLKGTVNTARIMGKQLRIQGIEVGSKAMFSNMLKAMEINQVHPIISEVFAFNEIKTALTSLENGNHFGKVVIRF